MCRSQCLLAFTAIFVVAVNSWDIAISTGDHIEFYSEGKLTNDKGVRSSELTALAYDAVFNMLLFVDKQSDNASLFRYYLSTKKTQRLVGRKSLENIQGVTFDPVSGKVFWTDGNEKGVYWKYSESKNDVYGHKFNFSMDDQVPRAIAVDSCRGYIYWTNVNVSKPTIERARIDGTERRAIINTDIYMPMSIVIDQQTKKIYWADDREGIYYSIESSDLDGSNRATVVKGIHHRPNALAVSKENLYWIDWGYSTVWSVPKTARFERNSVEPEQLFTFAGAPFGLVANYTIEDQTAGVPECEALRSLSMNITVISDAEMIPTDVGVLCLHGIKLAGKSECKCSLGYTGKRCEIPVCQNYCLQGECSVVNGQPKCSCKNGYSGSRCEVDLCFERCLNDGQCVIENQKPICKCSKDFMGSQCEILKTVPVERSVENIEKSCNCTDTNAATFFSSENQLANEGIVEMCNNSWDPLRDPVIMVLGALSGMLCVACAVLTTKVMKLQKRPRIKKRIIVQKNTTPLTARPDQCEITIENCCNMNICETPCFEPRSTIRPTLLDAKRGKDEKKNLIANMELPDDY